jgi:hypothetical protein
MEAVVLFISKDLSQSSFHLSNQVTDWTAGDQFQMAQDFSFGATPRPALEFISRE